jgi:CheY-like chemotaxis protein
MAEPVRLLIVDDDPDTQVYLSSLLEDHGYEAEAASSADEALEILSRRPPDVMLLDVVLRGASGLDLLVRLRRDPLLADLPILMLSGHDSIVADRGASYLAAHPGVRGPDGALGKPVDTGALLAAVAQLAGR